MDFRPVGFALPYSCRFCSGLAADRVCSIVKGLRHTAGILRGHQVLHHAADGSAYCKFGMENRSGVWFITPRCPNPKLFLEVFIHGKML